jgi:hypothetical protein
LLESSSSSFSQQLLAESERALRYPRLRNRISATDAEEFVTLLRVSGDQHVLALADRLPIQTARMFLESLGTTSHG